MSIWFRAIVLIFLLALSACETEDIDGVNDGDSERTEQGDDPKPGDEPDDNNDDVGEEEPPELSTGRITYVGKQSNIVDFQGYGQHLFYFPAFDLDSPDDFHRTDKGAAYFNSSFQDFVHHRMFSFNTRTFSPDAGGSPLGVKARGGYDDWPIFVLPNGLYGLSGVLYDDATRQNSNNTFNQINLTKNSPKKFCLNIILDNTLENIPDVKLVVRSDQSKEDLSLKGHPDLVFDGQPDMYTFRYTDMKSDGRIKIKMATSMPDGKDGKKATGAGIAGVMISHYSTCAPDVE